MKITSLTLSLRHSESLLKATAVTLAQGFGMQRGSSATPNLLCRFVPRLESRRHQNKGGFSTAVERLCSCSLSPSIASSSFPEELAMVGADEETCAWTQRFLHLLHCVRVQGKTCRCPNQLFSVALPPLRWFL